MDLIEILLLKYLNQNKIKKEEFYKNKIFERISLLINSKTEIESIFLKKNNLIMFFLIIPKIKENYRKLLKLLLKKFIYNKEYIIYIYEIYEYFSQSRNIKNFFKLNDFYPDIELMKKDLTKILLNFDLKLALIELFDEVKINFLKLFIKIFYETKKKYPNFLIDINFNLFEKILIKYINNSKNNKEIEIFYKNVEKIKMIIDNKVIFLNLLYNMEDFILNEKKKNLDVIYLNEIKTKFQKNTIYNIKSKNMIDIKNTFKDENFCAKNYIIILNSIKNFNVKNNLDYLVINSDLKNYIKTNNSIKKFFKSNENIEFLINYLFNTYDIELNKNIYFNKIFDTTHINNFKDFLPLSFLKNKKFKKYFNIKPSIIYLKTKRSMQLIKLFFNELIFQEISKINNNFINIFFDFLIIKLNIYNKKFWFFDYNILGYLLIKILKVSFISIEKILSSHLIIFCLYHINFNHCLEFIIQILSLKVKNKMVFYSEIKLEILNYIKNINFLEVFIKKFDINNKFDFNSLPSINKKETFELIISNNRYDYYNKTDYNKALENNLILNNKIENKLLFYDVDNIHKLINLEDISFLSSGSSSSIFSNSGNNITNSNLIELKKLTYALKPRKKFKNFIDKIISINKNKKIFKFSYFQDHYLIGDEKTYNNLEDVCINEKINFKNKKNLLYLIDDFDIYINNKVICSLYPFDKIYPENKWYISENKDNNFEIEKQEQYHYNLFLLINNIVNDIIFYGKKSYINKEDINIFPYKFEINIKDLLVAIFENYYYNILEFSLVHFFKYISILNHKNNNNSCYISINLVVNIINSCLNKDNILSIYKKVFFNKLKNNLENLIRVLVNLYAIKYSKYTVFPMIVFYFEKILFILNEIINDDEINKYKIIKKIPFMVFEILLIFIENEKSLLIINYSIKIFEKILIGKSMRYKKFLIFQINFLGKIYNKLQLLIKNEKNFNINLVIIIKKFIENNKDMLENLLNSKTIINKILTFFEMVNKI